MKVKFFRPKKKSHRSILDVGEDRKEEGKEEKEPRSNDCSQQSNEKTMLATHRWPPQHTRTTPIIISSSHRQSNNHPGHHHHCNLQNANQSGRKRCCPLLSSSVPVAAVVGSAPET